MPSRRSLHRLLPARPPTCLLLFKTTRHKRRAVWARPEFCPHPEQTGLTQLPLQAGAAPATPLRCPAHLPMHTQGTIRALGGTRLGWEPGLHWLRAHPPAPGCGPTELSTARGYLLVPSSFPLVPFFCLLHAGWGQAGGLPSPVRWRAGSSRPSLSSHTELPFTSNALLLAESSSSSTATLEGTESTP